MDTGLRLRYEFSRNFAPYLGVFYAGKFGQSASNARRVGLANAAVPTTGQQTAAPHIRKDQRRNGS
jgi:uncharacterized protein involved in copper resistance